MAYDPQRSRPRQRPSAGEASIVDTLLDGTPDPTPDRVGGPEPAASPGTAAEPPSAWSERLLYSVGASTVLGALASLTALWGIWRAWRKLARRGD